MSYILDALRKADQQRQRGAAPTLLMGQLTEAAPKPPARLYYGLIAALLLGAGMLIGWLRPWQAEPRAANVAAATPADVGLRQLAPVRSEITSAPVPGAPAQGAIPAAPAAPAPASSAAPVAAAAPAPVAVKSPLPASARAKARGEPQDAVAPVQAAAPPQPRSGGADSAPAQPVFSIAELPLALQQELPPMTISVHAYSGRPADRLVGINNRMLREGDSVAPGLILEQITQEGMVFGYKGYSFRRGVK